ncbi:MAG: threonylcarbamoyl-AMP synthase [Candidatus Eremiobacteraeota bacterium]|nr:threonylcarbamoyl-AMP synthase [Candidatus Eremiobacteraeota bacterium]
MRSAVKRLIDARKETLERVLDEVTAVVQGGGIVVYPTDTVYSVGCDPYEREAIAKIYASKARPHDGPLSLYLASVQEALEYVSADPFAAVAVRRTMPGPIALVIPRPAYIPERVTFGNDGLGLRVPDHPLASAILERCGPLAGTSASRGDDPPYWGDDDLLLLPDCDLAVLDGPTPQRARSTILDITRPTPRIVRNGVIPAEVLEEKLGTRIARPYDPDQ